MPRFPYPHLWQQLHEVLQQTPSSARSSCNSSKRNLFPSMWKGQRSRAPQLHDGDLRQVLQHSPRSLHTEEGLGLYLIFLRFQRALWIY